MERHQASYAAEHVIAALKAARVEQKLSQRELSAKAGVPQSHISKIENGAVDIQLSSLIAFARALDLEVMLVSRRSVPAVQAVLRSSGVATSRRGENAPMPRPAYSLDEEEEEEIA
jgi:transcriptional regulator with XRE-family HTH domain